MRLQRTKYVGLRPRRHEGHHVAGDDRRVERFGLAGRRKVESRQVSHQPGRARMVFCSGGNQLRVDVHAYDLMSAPMQLCADAARAASAQSCIGADMRSLAWTSTLS